MPSEDVEKIVERIAFEKKIPQEEVRQMMKAKQEEYGGLLTEEGAALAVARKLAVPLAEEKIMKIRALSPEMRNISLRVRIDTAFPTREFEFEGSRSNVTNFVVSDDTRSVRFVAWRQKPETLAALVPGATVKITNAYAKQDELRGLEVHLSRLGSIQVEMPGPPAAGVPAAAQPAAARRVSISRLTPEDKNVETRADIMRLYPPKTIMVCAACGARFQNACTKCGGTSSRPVLVLNADLDDGTGVVRGVFFRRQAEQLLGFTAEQYEKSPALFQQASENLLGEERAFTGDARQGINRLELIVRSLKNIDVEKEIRILTEKNG